MATADRMLRVLNVFAFHFVAATTRRRNQTIDDVKQPPQKRYTKQTPGGMFIDPPVPVSIISTSLGWKDARTGCVCVCTYYAGCGVAYHCVTAGVNKPRPGPAAAAAGRGQAFRQKRIRRKVESQESKNELLKCFPNKREAQQLLFFSFAIA
jgi:hypothetical protein